MHPQEELPKLVEEFLVELEVELLLEPLESIRPVAVALLEVAARRQALRSALRQALRKNRQFASEE